MQCDNSYIFFASGILTADVIIFGLRLITNSRTMSLGTRFW